jgi:hypothetical protein
VTRLAAILLALAALVAAGCGGNGDGVEGRADDGPARTETVERTKVEVIESPGDAADGRAFDSEAIFKRDGPGVVTIISIFGEEGGGEGEGGLFGGRGDEEGGDPQGGVGSGFVVNERGEIATNAHVVTQGEGKAIKKASQVYVKFADDNQVPAKIIGFDPNADIALLRLEDPKGLTLRPIELGQSDDVRVGAPVVAIGSPFGEEQSLSVGVVSATIARSTRSPASRRSARCRPTRRSTRATRAVRSSTRRARSSASTPRSARAAAAARASATPSPSTRSAGRSTRSASAARSATPTSASRRPPCTRSSPTASSSARDRRVGAGDRQGRPGRRRRPARPAAARRASRRAQYRPGGDVIVKIGDTDDPDRERPRPLADAVRARARRSTWRSCATASGGPSRSSSASGPAQVDPQG